MFGLPLPVGIAMTTPVASSPRDPLLDEEAGGRHLPDDFDDDFDDEDDDDFDDDYEEDDDDDDWED